MVGMEKSYKKDMLLQCHYSRKFFASSMFSPATPESYVRTGLRWGYAVGAWSRFRWKLHPFSQITHNVEFHWHEAREHVDAWWNGTILVHASCEANNGKLVGGDHTMSYKNISLKTCLKVEFWSLNWMCLLFSVIPVKRQNVLVVIYQAKKPYFFSINFCSYLYRMRLFLCRRSLEKKKVKIWSVILIMVLKTYTTHIAKISL